MAKKQRASSSASAAVASAESPSPDAAMDSPAPAAAASSARVRSSKASSKASSSSKAGSSSNAHRSPNLHATFNLPRGWESNAGVAASERDLSVVAKEVPDAAYLRPRIAPQNRCQRWSRRVLWTWKIHAVTTMLDPFEVALLTFMTIGMLVALGMYLASFWNTL